MNSNLAFYKSSIGKKWIVAITGLLMVGFVVGHLIGNLQVFLGWESLNRYAAFLKSIGELLWIVRVALIIAVVAHIVATIQLALANRAARPEKYERKRAVKASLMGRTMIWSGAYLLCFVVVHLLHFTILVIHPEYREMKDALNRPDVFHMVLIGFSNPLMSGFYIVGMLLLCSHLAHGIGSMTQTLGIQTRKLTCLFTCGGRALAVLLAIGYISIPVAVLAGYGKEYRERGAAPLKTTALVNQKH